MTTEQKRPYVPDGSNTAPVEEVHTTSAKAQFAANQKAASRALLIEACTFIIDGDSLDAEAAVSVMTDDERADLVNALDDLRGLIERVAGEPS